MPPSSEGEGRALSFRQSLLLVLLLSALLGGLGLLFVRQQSSGALEITIPTVVPPTVTPIPELKVYVSGAVARPGVYPLQGDSRVQEAIAAAGGPSSEADLLRINLAQRIRDEDHIHVPKQGEASSPTTSAKGSKININTASAALLDTLPGIGEARSKKIVDYRTQHGPFSHIEELMDLKLIPASVFEGIKDRITVD